MSDNKNNPNIVKVLFLNANSIVNKIDILRAHVCTIKPHIIAINESWTNCDITDSYLKIDSYTLIGRLDRSDTKAGRGGGLLIYSCLPNAYLNSSSSKFSQNLSLTVQTHQNEPDHRIPRTVITNFLWIMSVPFQRIR